METATLSKDCSTCKRTGTTCRVCLLLTDFRSKQRGDIIEQAEQPKSVDLLTIPIKGKERQRREKYSILCERCNERRNPRECRIVSTICEFCVLPEELPDFNKLWKQWNSVPETAEPVIPSYVHRKPQPRKPPRRTLMDIMLASHTNVEQPPNSVSSYSEVEQWLRKSTRYMSEFTLEHEIVSLTATCRDEAGNVAKLHFRSKLPYDAELRERTLLRIATKLQMFRDEFGTEAQLIAEDEETESEADSTCIRSQSAMKEAS